MTIAVSDLQSSWHVANQQYLTTSIEQIRQRLEHYVDLLNANVDIPLDRMTKERSGELSREFQSGRSLQLLKEDHADDEVEPFWPPNGRLFALDQLCQLFQLSPFERGILLLCAGVELDSRMASLCAAAQGDPQCRYPTFSLALAILPHHHWSAIGPNAPLRFYRLLDLGAGNALTASPLRIDERILHYLVGNQYLDGRLMGLVQPIATQISALWYAEHLVESHQVLTDRFVQAWVQSMQQEQTARQLALMQICGEDSTSKYAIAAAACQQLGLELYVMLAETMPLDWQQLIALKNLCEREYLISDIAILIDCDQWDSQDAAKEMMLSYWVDHLNCPLILISRDRYYPRQRPVVTLQANLPTYAEQATLWQQNLEPILDDQVQEWLDRYLEPLTSQFKLSAPTIQTACCELTAKLPAAAIDTAVTADMGEFVFDSLWDVCRSQSRSRLGEMAQRIETGTAWDELVLPDKEKQVLRDIAAHVRRRSQVYEMWGFGARGSRGLGITAMFAGASGTGKTTAAEVLGQALKLDVYRVDLSRIVSKYIGETEKNLRRVFDTAEGNGVILLFDEADALFSKRSDVKDSRDRYANMEVSYLLQRMEAYQGLAILTTNLKNSIDQAFLRRIRFVVQFPFPDASQRAEIWQRIFPAQTPIADLDFEKLAKLSIAGGNIRNIALNAAFLAADANEPVQMKHILQSAKSEYMKLERPLTEAEVKNWI